MADIYTLRLNEVRATGIYRTSDNAFIVQKGSTAVHKLPPEYAELRSNIHLQKKLVDQGILRTYGLQENRLVFTSDHQFNSPSQAAEVILQRDTNGPQYWINDTTKKPLGEEHSHWNYDTSKDSQMGEQPQSSSKASTPQGSERPQKFESEGWVRNKKVADEAKIRAGYRCQTCGLKFEDTYGELGSEFLEAHHLFPVSKREKEETQITADEIAALCSNCHRMIHRLLSSGEATEENQLETLKSIIEEHKP